jgi:hypothetical protein
MDQVVALTEYLPVGVALVGLVLVGSGLRALDLRHGRRPWPAWALTYLLAFRGVVVGACLVGAAWGWAAHIDWLLAASVCIGVGEFLESSYYLVLLEWGSRSGRVRLDF